MNSVYKYHAYYIHPSCILHLSKNVEKFGYNLLYIPCAFVKLLRNEKMIRILMNIKNDVKLLIDVIVKRMFCDLEKKEEKIKSMNDKMIW